MAGIHEMDVRTRITTCLLLKKLEKNQEYCQQIGVRDSSHFANSSKYDKNGNVMCMEKMIGISGS